MSNDTAGHGSPGTKTMSLSTTITIHGISVLEDLWEDYHFFRERALATSPQQDLKLYKRFVRAALLALFNYLEGVLNKWVVVLNPSADLHRLSTYKKLDIVQAAIRQKKHTAQDVSGTVRKAKDLRNILSHFKPTDDQQQLFRDLTNHTLLAEADKVISWIEFAKMTLGIEAHPNMAKVVQEFADLLTGMRPPT
jgi:hypothetical protein